MTQKRHSGTLTATIAARRRGAIIPPATPPCGERRRSGLLAGPSPPFGRGWHLNEPALYRLPVIPRCGRVGRQAHHVWGMDDAGIFLSQRTGGGRAAAFGTRRERACLPAGSDDRQPARGDGARGSGAAGGAEPVGGL